MASREHGGGRGSIRPVAPRPRVLVIEDDAALRRVLELRLRVEGFEVSVAEDGQEGLDVLDQVRPQAAVCDLMMPRVNGLDFCVEARRRLGFEDLPIVLLTAHQRDPDIDQLLELGGIVYMNKPFDARSLTETLQRLVAERALGAAWG